MAASLLIIFLPSHMSNEMTFSFYIVYLLLRNIRGVYNFMLLYIEMC